VSDQEIYVESAAALSDALSHAQGGETILLAAGDYGALSIYNKDFSGAGITIRSADPDDRASFSRLDLRGSSDIAFADITFDYVARPGAPISTNLAYVAQSENISFTGMTFLGDPAISGDPADHGYGAGFGLRVSDSRGITVEDSAFSGLFKGMHLRDTKDIVLRDNEISEFRSDGLNLVNVQNVLVEGNHIHSPERSFLSDDHPDMIQMWSSARTPEDVSRDVTFRGNLLDIGSGDYAQGLYLSNRPVSDGDKGAEFLYQNFVIEDNVIIGDHINALRVGPTDGLVISNNSLLHVRNEEAPNRFDKSPHIHLDGPSQNVSVTGNLAGAVIADGSREGWVVADNVLMQRRDYADHFAGVDPEAPPQGMDAVLAAYRFFETSPFAGQVGADLLQPLPDLKPAPPPPTADPVKRLGGSDDDRLEGGDGGDTLLLRFGADSAFGGAGADTFVLDGRYTRDGDAHLIEDLDFAEGDALLMRFVAGSTTRIDSIADLEKFIATDGVSAQLQEDGLVLDPGGGARVTLTGESYWELG